MIKPWFTRTTSPSNGHGAEPLPHLIDLRNVVKNYESAAGTFTALHDVNLQIDRGEFVAVIGKSGSGKSTLINTITGIDRPTSGEVFVAGTPIHTLNEGRLAVWRGKNVGVVFQFFQLLPTLTVVEYVMLPMDFCHLYTARERRVRALHLLTLVDMADHAHKLPSALSGGQQQRVAIARALANDPPIIVADEPTGNLDSKTAESVFNLFEELVDQDKTILMVTHDQDLAQRVSRTVIIADGEIIDQYLAKALPVLTEDQLVRVSYKLEPRTFPPGATIIREGQIADTFYIITKGRVEVVLQEPGGSEVIVTMLGPGQYFGEVELIHGGSSIATIRAGHNNAVDVVTLDKASFNQLIAESPAALEAIHQVADERQEENITAREGEEITSQNGKVTHV